MKRVVIFIFLLTLIRLTLLGRGMLAFPDEVWYLHTLEAIKSFVVSDYHGFWYNIFATASRPGFALINLIPGALQYQLWHFWGVPLYNHDSLFIPQVFYLFVSSLVLFMFYLIARVLLRKDSSMPILATDIFGFLVNSNVYLRHLLPYDSALLFLLLATYIVLTQKLTLSRSIFFGLLIVLGYITYPGYFILIAVNIFIYFFSLWQQKQRKLLKLFLSFYMFLSISIPLILLAVIAPYGGQAYLTNSTSVLQTVSQGSSSEIFSFLFTYLINVESFTGIFLLIVSFCSLPLLTRTLFGNSKSINKKFSFMVLSLFVGYFFYALYGHMHSLVNYGRLIRMYIPFLVLSSCFFLSTISNRKIRIFLFVAFFSFSLYSFTTFYFQYRSLNYPVDVLYQLGINTTVQQANYANEANMLRRIDSLPPWSEKTQVPYIKKGSFTLVNVGYFYQFLNTRNTYKPLQSETLIFSTPHFLTYVPYMYEGFSLEERKYLRGNQFTLRVYQQNK